MTEFVFMQTIYIFGIRKQTNNIKRKWILS